MSIPILTLVLEQTLLMYMITSMILAYLGNNNILLIQEVKYNLDSFIETTVKHNYENFLKSLADGYFRATEVLVIRDLIQLRTVWLLICFFNGFELS